MSNTRSEKQVKLDIRSRRHTKQNKKPISTGIHEIGRDTKKPDILAAYDVDKVLKAFDLNDQYGPCVGIKRLVRWERAKSLGLDPPSMIKDILLLKDKSAKKYQESLFDKFRSI